MVVMKLIKCLQMVDGYWIAIIGFVGFYVLSAKYWKSRRKALLINKIPGPKPYPVLGNIIMFLIPREKILPTFSETHQTFGDIFRTWHGYRPVVHLVAPEYIELVLGANKHIRKGKAYDFLLPWLGTGLLTSAGRKWFLHRKLISPTFHFKVLEGFIEVFNECSQVLVRKLQEKADGSYFDVCPFITRCALDIICETAMGTRIEAQEKEQSLFVEATLNASKLISERQFTSYLHQDFIFYNSWQGKEFLKVLKILHGFTENVIKERKSLRSLMKNSEEYDNDSGGKKRLAFLDLLLEASEGHENLLSDIEIREEVDTFMFEGHDTTNTAISWTLLLLGNHIEIQNAVREELQRIFGCEDRPITLRDLGEMKLLERVIKESLRLYPSVAIITRLLDQDLVMGKYLIPAETNIVMHIYCMHRHPSLFPNPLKFDPDRFLPENCQKRHPYAYIPFSAGQRNCIGQKFAMHEEKVMLASILRKFKVSSLETPSQVPPQYELVNRPKGGISIKLIPIDS